MVRDARAYLWDVQAAAEAIRQFTQGLDAAGYAAKKAPDLFSEQVMPKLEERGSDEAAKVGKKAMGKMTGGSSGVMGKIFTS